MSTLLNNIEKLSVIYGEIAELEEKKAALIEEIVTAMDAQDLEGSKQESLGKYKVELRRPRRYEVNSDEYEVLRNQLPADLNPVEERVSYKVDTKLYKRALEYASEQELELLHRIVPPKFQKVPSVKISFC